MGIITEIKIIQRNKQRNNNFHNLTYKISRVEKNDLPIEGKNHNYQVFLVILVTRTQDCDRLFG